MISTSTHIIKQEFIALLLSTKRHGIERVTRELESMGFFESPASRETHFSYDGGLMKHSLNVYHVASSIASNMRVLCPSLHIPEESVIITSLLHDVCKTTRYHKKQEFVKEDGTIEQRYVKDFSHFPIGHGEKSVIQLLRWGLELTEDEMLAIRYHMGPWQLSLTNEEQQQDYREACTHHPLVAIIHAADTLAAQIIEMGSNTKGNKPNT